VTTYDAGAQELATIALDRQTGQLRWYQVAPAAQIEQVHRVGNPAAATPACDGERVYVFFGSYGLLCYDLKGSLVWSRPLGPFQDEFGAASSPILVDDLLILNEDHDTDNYLYAFEAKTGESRWQVPRNEFTRSYSTPIVFEHDGRKQIVVAGALTLTGYDIGSGERLWWRHGLARIVNTTPTVHNGKLIVATWSPGGDVGERITMEDWDAARRTYDTNEDGLIREDELSPGPVLTRFFRIDINQDGGLDRSEWEKQAHLFDRAENSTLALRVDKHGELGEDSIVWKYSKGVPYVASPVCAEDVVYVVKDGGIFSSLDAETGDVLKKGRLKGRGSYYSSPVVADGKIYVASEQGVISVLSADGEWQILAFHDFGESIYATPMVADGRLFVRTDAALYCFAEPK
jgi:outer membrane protein assembly factor BamB